MNIDHVVVCQGAGWSNGVITPFKAILVFLKSYLDLIMYVSSDSVFHSAISHFLRGITKSILLHTVSVVWIYTMNITIA